MCIDYVIDFFFNVENTFNLPKLVCVSLALKEADMINNSDLSVLSASCRSRAAKAAPDNSCCSCQCTTDVVDSNRVTPNRACRSQPQ